MIKFIHQVLPNYSRRDAVGNDTFLIRDFLRKVGIQSEIFHEESGEASSSRPLSDLNQYLNRQDTAILFHFSIGSNFPGIFSYLSNKKMVRYHNITPPEFFSDPGEVHIFNACNRGRQQIPMLSAFSDLIIGDSAYNCREFTCYSPVPARVVPIFRDYDHLKNLPASNEYEHALKNSDKPSILFVGRICPNKAQHDLLKMIALYKATFNAAIGLVLVGGFFSPAFRKEIENYARYLGLSLSDDIEAIKYKDVIITGSISDEEMASLYRHCTLFCSLSDHEGFGVPLVEALNFGLPVLAHSSSAVPETLGGAGLLVDKTNWRSLLATLRFALSSPEFRQELAQRGIMRAADLSLGSAEKAFAATLENHLFSN